MEFLYHEAGTIKSKTQSGPENKYRKASLDKALLEGRLKYVTWMESTGIYWRPVVVWVNACNIETK
jgi:hypothetical protein